MARYYWLKLHDNFFDRLEIKKLRMMPGGDTLTIIYLKLLLLSLNDDGRIPFEGIESNISKELSLKINEDELSIQMALNALQMIRLVEEREGDVELTEHEKVTGNSLPKPSKKALPENIKKKYGSEENIPLSQKDIDKLLDFFGSERIMHDKIEAMSVYCKAKGKTYKDYAAALINWARRDNYKKPPSKKSFEEGSWL